MRPTCSCSTSSAARRTACARSSRDPAHGAGEFQLIPVLRARVVGRRPAARRTSTASRTCAQRGVARRASSRSPIAITSSRTSASSTGAFWNGPSAEPEVSVEQADRASGSRLHVGDTMRFDILGRIDQRARHQHPRRRMARVAQRRLHVRVPARARSTRRRRPSSRRSRGRTALAARGAVPARPGRAVSRTSR